MFFFPFYTLPPARIIPPPPLPYPHAPPQAIETLLSIDFAAPVLADTALAERLSEDPAIAGALGLLPEASLPIVVRGEMLKSWLAQPDDPRVED